MARGPEPFSPLVSGGCPCRDRMRTRRPLGGVPAGRVEDTGRGDAPCLPRNIAACSPFWQVISAPHGGNDENSG